MGCCSGRFNKPADTNIQEAIDKSHFSSIHSNYLSNKQNFYKKTFNLTITESKQLNEELEELSLARETISIEKLAKLMTSETPVLMQPDTCLHTWAENPKSIGTLAVIQIGIFASDKESYNNEKFVKDLFRFKVLQVLMQFCQSKDRDKFEAAVLAFSFLTENSQEVVEEMLAKGLLAVMIRFMQDRKEGLKATASLCCRNLYMARPKVQKLFVQGGGAELMISMLDTDDSVVVFETILNVLDLLLDADDTVQLDIKKDLITLNLPSNLQRILTQQSRYEQETIREAEKLLQLFE